MPSPSEKAVKIITEILEKYMPNTAVFYSDTQDKVKTAATELADELSNLDYSDPNKAIEAIYFNHLALLQDAVAELLKNIERLGRMDLSDVISHEIGSAKDRISREAVSLANNRYRFGAACEAERETDLLDTLSPDYLS